MKLIVNEDREYFDVNLQTETVEESTILMRLGANSKKGDIDIRTYFSGNNINSSVFVKYKDKKKTSIGNNDK